MRGQGGCLVFRVPLPPPICSDKPGTWAYDTITRRLRTDILARIWRENDFFDADAVASLQALSAELETAASCVLTPIPNDGGPDCETWNSVILSEYIGKYTWLTAPYCLVEFYFYRRLMAAVHWFRDRRDPFQKQKELGVQSSLEVMFGLLKRLSDIGRVRNDQAKEKVELVSFLFLSLWGNRLDLSLWPVAQGTEQGEETSHRKLVEFVARASSESDKLLVNDSDRVFQYLYSTLFGTETKDDPTSRRVDIIVDNAGLELFCDMCLAHYLIASGIADQVVFHLKAYPVFVSDAMEKDLWYMIGYLEEMSTDQSEHCRRILQRWRLYFTTGQWRTKEDYFWCQPWAFWEMPDAVEQDLRDHSLLVILKGDANYRRLLGDREWTKTTAFGDVVSYFPTAVCALRTLKSEILCGVDGKQIDYAQQKDPRWLVSGEWAVVQFYH
jgi:uncharacterized protein with ATP-grasp and redox domains